MKKIYIFLAIVISLIGCSKHSEQNMEVSPYVQVQKGKFVLNGHEYRYVGTNFWYGAILGSEGRGGNRERLVKELDDMHALGIDNVRVLIGGDGREGIPSHISPKLQLEPGVYNDTILDGLDYMMAELEKRNMKAVLYFNNAWEWSGGYGAYLDWVGFSGDVISGNDEGTLDPRGFKIKHFDRAPIPSYDGWFEYMQYVGNFVLNDSAKTLAANHVRNMVTRTNRYTGKPYAESTALMAWEIANEPRCFVNDSLHKAKFVEWIDEQSSLIKSLDPNHLVTTGSEGYNGCEQDMQLFSDIHTLPNIDYACIHIWPNNWGWLGQFNQNYDANKTIDINAPDPIIDRVDVACQKTLAYIDEAFSCMQKAGRPIVLEEFGYPRDRFLFTPGSSTKGRDAYYQYVFSIIRDSGKIAGCNFWGWGGSANVKNVIWQPYDDYVCDPAQEEQGLNSVFSCDTTTIQLIKELATTPFATLSCINDSDWVWLETENAEPLKFEAHINCLTGIVQHFDSLEIRITDDKGAEVFQTEKRYPAYSGMTYAFELKGNLKREPGFYHISIYLNGKNATHNVTEVYGKQMVIDHYCFGIEPEEIVSAPDAQPDFEAFWNKARAELAATPIKARVKELKERNGEKREFVADLQGLDGANVQVYYTIPRQPGKFPLHILNMGYSSKPWPLDLNDNGYIDVIVSSRGQGANNDTNIYGDWIQYGLDNPNHYYYRGAYLDCTRAIDYMVTLPEADATRIFLEGGSQGGAYSMAAAALDHRITAIAAYIPFMSDFPDYFEIAEWPGSAVKSKQTELGLSDEELYRNLSYFDIKNLAGWIECPVFMAIGLQDITCPAHTNFAGYNQIKSPKMYNVYPNYGHHVDYNHWTPTMYRFFEGL